MAYLMVHQAGMLDALSDAAEAGIISKRSCSSSELREAGEAGRDRRPTRRGQSRSIMVHARAQIHLGVADLTDGVPVRSIPGLPR